LTVHGEKLNFFSQGVGFFKDGYCRTGPDDKRHLSVAAIMTHAFHQCEFGDGPKYKGIAAGDKTCISAHDFKDAIREMGPAMGPKVYLSATDKKALDIVPLEDLQKFAIPNEKR
jgi:uncharacterized protein